MIELPKFPATHELARSFACAGPQIAAIVAKIEEAKKALSRVAPMRQPVAQPLRTMRQ